MKKYISIIVLCFCLGMQYKTFAESPCTTRFALNYAFAVRDLADGKKACEGETWTGACLEEVNRIFRHTTNTLVVQFNACCCENAYVECCN